jgi:hypothetical protein
MPHMSLSGGNPNPYASPAADQDPVAVPGRRLVRLYSPPQVAAAAFIGSPLAASWLFASNYSALGDKAAARRTLLYGLIGTVAAFGIGFALPVGFPPPILPIAYTVVIRGLAKQAHGEAFENHLAAGGARQSTWRVLGVCLVGLLVVVPLAFGLALLLPPETPAN